MPAGSFLQLARGVIRKHLKPNPNDMPVVDFLLSVAATNFLSNKPDPLWGWLIGPPGSMKTELLRAFEDHPRCLLLSTLTPNSLISGYVLPENPDGSQPEDPSLLPKFDGKLVVIKEFTSIMGLPDVQTRQIFGDLRGIYDGMHGKGLGTCGIKKFKSRFSMICAVTPVVDKYTLVHQDLGERFLSLRIGSHLDRNWTERTRVARHVWDASLDKDDWRIDIKETFQAAVTKFATCPPSPPEVPPAQRDALIELGDLLAILRSISADETPNSVEIASRTVQQARWLASGRAIADGRDTVDDSDVDLVRRVVRDTLPSSVTRFITDLFLTQKSLSDGNMLSLDAISKDTRTPVSILNKIATQYVYTGILQRSSERVRFTTKFMSRLEPSGLFL